MSACVPLRQMKRKSNIPQTSAEEEKSRRRYLSPAQAAEVLGVCVRTLIRWELLGRIRALRMPLSGERRFLESDVYNLLSDPPPAPLPVPEQFVTQAARARAALAKRRKSNRWRQSARPSTHKSGRDGSQFRLAGKNP
jgi:hypothetical protein